MTAQDCNQMHAPRLNRMPVILPAEKVNIKSPVRVYIVEDSEIIRIRLASLFAEIEGLELVGQAGSVKVATADILRLQPDVVLLDIKLTDGNGLDMLESLRALGMKVKAIVMTFDPYHLYRKRASELGAIHFIDKAKDLGNIQLILEQIVAEQYVSLNCVTTGEIRACRQD